MWIPIGKTNTQEKTIDGVKYIVNSIYADKDMIFDKMEQLIENDFKSSEILKNSIDKEKI